MSRRRRAAPIDAATAQPVLRGIANAIGALRENMAARRCFWKRCHFCAALTAPADALEELPAACTACGAALPRDFHHEPLTEYPL